jgi:hypothetical protein
VTAQVLPYADIVFLNLSTKIGIEKEPRAFNDAVVCPDYGAVTRAFLNFSSIDEIFVLRDFVYDFVDLIVGSV